MNLCYNTGCSWYNITLNYSKDSPPKTKAIYTIWILTEFWIIVIWHKQTLAGETINTEINTTAVWTVIHNEK